MDHMTFAQLLGNYGEFGGAIVVFRTLAYLTIQVRQNTRSINAPILLVGAKVLAWRRKVP